MGPLYPNLRLIGSVHARAGNPELDAALKKLIKQALEPLERLNGELAYEAAPPATPPEAPEDQALQDLHDVLAEAKPADWEALPVRKGKVKPGHLRADEGAEIVLQAREEGFKGRASIGVWIMDEGYDPAPADADAAHAKPDAREMRQWRGRRVFVGGDMPQPWMDWARMGVLLDTALRASAAPAAHSGVLPEEADELARLAAILLSDEFPDAREAAMAMGKLRSPAAMDVLIGALPSADAQTAMGIGIALGQIGDARANDALMSLFDREDALQVLASNPLNETLASVAHWSLLRIASDKTGKAFLREGLVPIPGDTGGAIKSREALTAVRDAWRTKLATDAGRPAAQPTGPWGEAKDGLRCRWVDPPGPVIAGSTPRVSVEVQNTASRPVLWQCRPEISWGLSIVSAPASRPSGYTMPGFSVKMGDGVRPVTAIEVREAFGVVKDENDYPGYYHLAPSASLILTAELPWAMNEPGKTFVALEVARYPLTGSTEHGDGGRMSCPALELTVEEEPSRRRLTGGPQSPEAHGKGGHGGPRRRRIRPML